MEARIEDVCLVCFVTSTVHSWDCPQGDADAATQPCASANAHANHGRPLACSPGALELARVSTSASVSLMPTICLPTNRPTNLVVLHTALRTTTTVYREATERAFGNRAFFRKGLDRSITSALASTCCGKKARKQCPLRSSVLRTTMALLAQVRSTCKRSLVLTTTCRVVDGLSSNTTCTRGNTSLDVGCGVGEWRWEMEMEMDARTGMGCATLGRGHSLNKGSRFGENLLFSPRRLWCL